MFCKFVTPTKFICWNLMEKEMATHSSILAWRIPWTEEPGRLQSMGSQRVRHDWATSLSLSLMPHMMILRCGAFERVKPWWWDYCSYKGDPRAIFCLLLHMRTRWKDSCLQSRDGALRHRPYWPLDLGFRCLELGENEFWLLKPKLSLTVFVWQSEHSRIVVD